jgi:hypothetical protein
MKLLVSFFPVARFAVCLVFPRAILFNAMRREVPDILGD